MVDEAIPGVPKKARWIQTGGRAMANPFFGAEMLECGKEIKP
jgi:Cu(I)/Ag(I) efflux system membrane fusion protein